MSIVYYKNNLLIYNYLPEDSNNTETIFILISSSTNWCLKPYPYTCIPMIGLEQKIPLKQEGGFMKIKSNDTTL